MPEITQKQFSWIDLVNRFLIPLVLGAVSWVVVSAVETNKVLAVLKANSVTQDRLHREIANHPHADFISREELRQALKDLAEMIAKQQAMALEPLREDLRDLRDVIRKGG